MEPSQLWGLAAETLCMEASVSLSVHWADVRKNCEMINGRFLAQCQLPASTPEEEENRLSLEILESQGY